MQEDERRVTRTPDHQTNPAIDKSKSIEQLENSYWLPPVFDSNVILRAHAVRRKPLADFSLADFSVALIQQGIHSARTTGRCALMHRYRRYGTAAWIFDRTSSRWRTSTATNPCVYDVGVQGAR